MCIYISTGEDQRSMLGFFLFHYPPNILVQCFSVNLWLSHLVRLTGQQRLVHRPISIFTALKVRTLPPHLTFVLHGVLGSKPRCLFDKKFNA